LSRSEPRSKSWRVWAVFAVLVIVIGALKVSDWQDERAAQQDSLAAGERSLLPVLIEGISAVEIAYEGALYRFERDQTGTWFYHAHGISGVLAEHGHVADPAQAELIATRLAGLGRARIERWLDSNDREQFGVTRPQLLLLVHGANLTKPIAQYAFGDVAPDKLSRYVLLVDTAEVVTVANYQAQNLIDLVRAVTAPPGTVPTVPVAPPPASNERS